MNKRIIAIGDTHGRDIWKLFAGSHKFDKFIFIGDYFDSADVFFEKQLTNFLDILEFKRQNPDKVVLLIGNHDFQYMHQYSQGETYSGYQLKNRKIIEHAFSTALSEGLLQMCHIEGDIIFTHAGVTKTWCEDMKVDLDNLENSINAKLLESPSPFRFRGFDPYGDDICQSPIWVRPQSLAADSIDGYRQVVGHTRVRTIAILKDTLALIDVLTTSKKALLIEDGIFSELEIEKHESEAL